MKLAFAAFAVLAPIVACGSSPKPEPDNAAPKTAPSATTAPTSTATATATTSTDDGGTTAAPASTAGDKAAQCDALLTDANSTLDVERIKVDKQCKKNEDCMPIKGRACNFTCENGAIPKAEEKDWNGALSKVKDGACKKWTESDCAKLNTKPAPTCQSKKPTCEAGHCTLK